MMGEGMAELRKRYNVPAKRGMIVWYGDETFSITSSDGYCVWAKDEEIGARYKFHPFEVDYQLGYDPVQNMWIFERGKDLEAAFDAQNEVDETFHWDGE